MSQSVIIMHLRVTSTAQLVTCYIVPTQSFQKIQWAEGEEGVGVHYRKELLKIYHRKKWGKNIFKNYYDNKCIKNWALSPKRGKMFKSVHEIDYTLMILAEKGPLSVSV